MGELEKTPPEGGSSVHVSRSSVKVFLAGKPEFTSSISFEHLLRLKDELDEPNKQTNKKRDWSQNHLETTVKSALKETG